ncbi:hypothetical protein FQN57_004556 [Myotisia sp. PD_48]|nr:hypothetical protein FQN57_004556 [Myotisia sp. PD_48]
MTLVLLALDSEAPSQDWNSVTRDSLCTWPVPYPEMRGADNSGSSSPSPISSQVYDFVPPKGQSRRGRPAASRISSYVPRQRSKKPPATGTRQHNALPYCTQSCLLHLIGGGPFDENCPNVSLHRNNLLGPISRDRLQEIFREQLGKTRDHDCEALDRFGKFGATGALFKLT